MTAIAGEGTAMERDYDYSSISMVPTSNRPEKVGRSAGERTVERLNYRARSTPKPSPGRVRSARGGLAGQHLASASQRLFGWPARPAFLKDKLGQHYSGAGSACRRPTAPAGLALAPVRRRGCRHQALAVIETGVLMSGFLDSATARVLGLTTTGAWRNRGVS